MTGSQIGQQFLVILEPPLDIYRYIAIYEYMYKLINLLKAVSDSTRFKIVKALGKGPFCVCEITEALGLAQPTISRHLHQLENAGLVSSRRDGQRIEYMLVTEKDGNQHAVELLNLLEKWEEDNMEIKKLRESLEQISLKIRGQG